MMRAFVLCAALATAVVPRTAASAPDKFFESNGVRIRYVDQGSGEPVLLIHGFTSFIEQVWDDTGVFATLSKDHRVIALDLRGHGKSEKPHDASAYGTEFVRDVVRLLDYLKITKAHIVGYSLGAQVTAKLLTMSPDRFITAILGGAAPLRRWTQEDESNAKTVAAEMEGEPTERTKALFSRGDPLALAAMTRARGQLAVTDSELASVRVPVRAIVGSADPALAGVNELKAFLPGLEIVVVDGAVHSPADPRGAPRRPEFASAIREFIAGHTKPSLK